MARVSYQDGLSANVTAEPYPCDACGAATPVWALYKSENDEPKGYICGRCIADHQDSKALPEPEPVDPWESEPGKFLKAQRNMKLSYDVTGWAIMPDSPLTPESKADFLAYRASLNRMTVDWTPDTWVWPTAPIKTYA